MSSPAGARIRPRWWGWGDPSVATELPEKAERLLASRGLLQSGACSPPKLEDVRLPGPRNIPESVRRAAGKDLQTDPEARLRHSGGHSLPDLLERRSGSIRNAPDGVVTPGDEATLRAVLDACREASVAVIPWGGGTSVVGGLTPEGDAFEAVIAIDTGNLTTFRIDRNSMTATLGAGLRGPEAEVLLGREGLTLGHFPQSFEFATIGGFAAARSAGQASSGYGRFDDLVTSLRMLTPVGEVITPSSPRSSSGPSIREMILGSEGVLGVISEVTARVRPAPESRLYEGWLVADYASGCDAARRLAQAGSLPTVLRVSDRHETEVSIGMSRPGGIPGRLFDIWVGLRGRSEGSLVITGFEGTTAEVRRRRSEAVRELSAAGAISLGSRAGRGWSEGRFHGPYLRESLLDRGLVVDTFETSATWSDYLEAHRSIRETTVDCLKSLGMKGLVMCHLSHCYPESASLYFTVIATPRSEGPAASWRAVKAAAMEGITSAGLTVSHHHGVGRDHAQWLESEVGEEGLAALRALKASLDPTGIMNPGCLLRRQPHDHHRPR